MPEPIVAPAPAPAASSAAERRPHRALFGLDPEVTFLNHGSFGATPLPVQAEQDRWRARLEAQPVRFLVRELPPALDAARATVASFLGARPADLAFVRNATSGVNAVVGSLPLRPGDRVLTTSHRYEAVGHTLAHITARQGAALDVVALPTPLSSPEVVLDRIADAITPQTRLLVVDHITSATALVLPVRRLATLARARGCLLLVDGAHAPGHLDVDLDRLGADFWTGNLHKWPCAPKGCAVLWAHPDHQPHLHPAVLSNFYGRGFQPEFDWCGTDDPSPWLAAPAALQLHEETFGGATFRAANIALAAEAGALLCDQLGLEPTADHPQLRCAMMAALLPAPASAVPALYAHLQAHQIEAVLMPWDGRALLRISAFSAYNHIEQYAHLARVLSDALARHGH